MKRRITGSEALVEALRLEGVEVMFGMVGSAFMDPLDLFPKAGIRFIQVRHEQSAALMAEGYARATSRPGVCIGQNGPGITNLVTGVASAFLNHVPLVVITPTVTSASSGTHSLQEVDQIKLLQPIVKWQSRVPRADRLAESIRGAFRAAICLRGPAQVDIPRDFYYGQWEEARQLAPKDYRVGVRRTPADAASIAEAAEILKAAKRPVFVAGLGAVESSAGAAIAALAERFVAPVATVWLHNDAYPASHRLAVGPLGYQGSKAAMKALREADVVLALGTRLNAFGLIPQYGNHYFPQDALLIHNTIEPLEIGAQLPIACGLVGDCAEVVSQLLDATASVSIDAEASRIRQQEIDRAKKEWADELAQMSSVSTQPINPRRAIAEIARALPKGAAVVCDVGNAVGTAGAYFGFDEALNWFAAGSLGGIGVGLASGLGVKLARPEQPVVLLIGDGAWSMALQELMTAVREKINLVVLILNNSVYGAERRNQVDFFANRYFCTDLENPSFAAIAETMGAVGIAVDSHQDIAPAVQKAFSVGRPVVIDIQLDPLALSEPYRRDAMREPVRLLPRYADAC